ncbi:DUF6531 domain-containing protein [Pendulispora brunnea]|uniref:DUF6531 domain-containing protein n=1 Tax=Pendulispora brunnea TaxID=2905690 RepID=A0ABZ2K9D6_9BACT
MRVNATCIPSPELAHRLVGDPVDVVTGACFDSIRDAIVDSPTPMEWRRYHDSRRTEDRGLGPGWRHSFDHRLVFDLDGIRYEAPSGTEVKFPFFGETNQLAERGYTLHRDGDRFELTPPEGPILTFRMAGRANARLESIGIPPQAIAVDYSPFDGSLVGFTDCAGNHLRIVYDGWKIIGIRAQPARDAKALDLARYTYDRGYLVDVEDAYHHHLRYVYDVSGRIAQRVDRRGYSFFFEFDHDGRCIRSGGEDGFFATSLAYYPLEGYTEVTEAGGVWKYFYDTNGTITRIEEPTGAAREFVVRPEDGQIAAEIDAAGREIHYLYNENGSLVGKRDSIGRWLRESADEPDLPSSPLEYEFGVPSDEHFELPAKWTAESTEIPVFGDSQPTSPKGHLPDVVFSSLVFATEPARGRLVEIRDIQGLLLREEQEGRTRRYGYDPNGNIQWALDFDGGRTEYKFASLNQLVETSDANRFITRFELTKDGEISATIDPAQVRTEFGRDAVSHLTGVRRAGVEKESYVHDPAGRLVAKRDAQGNPLYTLKLGPQGEILERAFTDGGFERFEYDARLRIVKAESPHANVSLAYDLGGRRILDERDGKGVHRHFLGDDLIDVRVLERFVTRYRYHEDSNHRTTIITDPTGREHRVRDLGNGVFERVFSSGISETAQYHPDGHCLLRSVYSADNPQTRWDRRYEYNGERNLLASHDSERGPTRYEHDAGHRLLVEHFPNGTSQKFAHDAAGNLLRNGEKTLSYWPGNFLGEANGRTFQHDARHAVSLETWTGGCRRFRRDSRDQLIAVEYFNLERREQRSEYVHSGTWTAKYDALNRRIEKSAAGATTTFYWEDNRLAAEVLPTGALRVYIYANALALTPILFVDYESVDADPKSGKAYAVFANHLGCPEAVQDMDGTYVWRARIAPYGAAHVEVGRDFHQPIRWPGHYFDAEIGLQYNRFRTYAPELGRYLEPDPIGRASGLENVYQYTVNPLRDVDIQGLTRVCPLTGKPIRERKRKGRNQAPDTEHPDAFPGIRRGGDKVNEHANRAAKMLHQLAKDSPFFLGPDGKGRSITVVHHEDGTVSVGVSGSDPGRRERAQQLVDAMNKRYPNPNARDKKTYRAAEKDVKPKPLKLKRAEGGNPAGVCSEPSAAQAVGENPSPPHSYQTIWSGPGENNHSMGLSTPGHGRSLMAPCATCQNKDNIKTYANMASGRPTP